MAPWVTTADGISVIQEIMTITFTALVPASKQISPAKPNRPTILSQSQPVPELEESVPEQTSVSTPERVPVVEPEQVPSLPSSPAPSPQTPPSPPAPVSSKKKDLDSEVETEDESMDEEEWKETEERNVEETPGRSHRTVTSRMIQRMKVGPDDMLIRTRGNSHPVFINVTRLQQLIREEGGMLENDPFIAYLGSIPTSLFVTGNDYERALAASQRIVGTKIPSNSGNVEGMSEESKEVVLEKWEMLGSDRLQVKTFTEWFELLGPVGRHMLPSKPADIPHEEIPRISDSQAIQEMKLDSLSLRRSTVYRLQNPIESLFSRLILNRIFPRDSSCIGPRTMLSTRIQKSLRSSQAFRQPRLNLLYRGDEERIPAVRAFTAACLLKQAVDVREKVWVDECLSQQADSADAWLTLLKQHTQNSEYFRNNPVMR